MATRNTKRTDGTDNVVPESQDSAQGATAPESQDSAQGATAPESQDRDAAASAPEVDKPGYVIAGRDDVVGAYLRGDVSKRTASEYVTKHGAIADAALSAAITHMSADMSPESMAAVQAANDDAKAWRSVAVALDDAKRSPVRPKRTGQDYAKAAVARALAYVSVAGELLKGAIVPGDVPESDALEYATALTQYLADDGSGSLRSDVVDMLGDAYTDALKLAARAASARVFANGSVAVHLRQAVDGHAKTKRGLPIRVTVGAEYTCAQIASWLTPEYPVTGPSSGYVATKIAVSESGERESTLDGWEYALVNGAHGLRFVGYDVPESQGESSDSAQGVPASA